MTPQQKQLQPHTPGTVEAEIEAAAVRFGEQLRRWRKAQGWSQNTAQDWGREIGIVHVFNSQWSLLETGKLRGAKPLLFRALGAMNALLAAQQYGPIRDRALLDRVRGAQPVRHDDGQPWDGADFYASYMGLLDWPDAVERVPPISDAQAAAFSSSYRDLVRTTAKGRSLSLSAAMAQLLEQVPEEHRARVEDVLLGENWTGEELTTLRREAGTVAPTAWLRHAFSE
jgi:transcriptional regulator with XRE-family HTH domain